MSNNSDRYRWLKSKDPETLCQIAKAAVHADFDEMGGNVDAVVDAAMAAERSHAASNGTQSDQVWPWA